MGTIINSDLLEGIFATFVILIAIGDIYCVGLMIYSNVKRFKEDKK